MKKRLISLLLTLLLICCSVSPAVALEGEDLRAADTLATLGLVQGTGNGYALNAPATRAHAAVLLVRLAGADSAAAAYTGVSNFSDVPAWAEAAINYAAAQGWIAGVSPTEFAPNRTITANAWCTMLLRMLGYSDHDGDFTVADAAAFARRIGLVSQSYTGAMTRGSLFQTMQDALSFPVEGYSSLLVRLVEQGKCSRAAANALGLLKPELTARQIADRHMAAAFQLDLYKSQEEIDAKDSSSNASGFFITKDGLALTNYHSIDGAIHATATLVTGDVYTVEKVIWYDAGIDMAVIKVSQTSVAGKTTSEFSALEVIGTKDIRAGDITYALSNPLGLGLAVSSGIISATAHDVDRYDLPCIVNSADISQGSSGGALLNVYGQVIAITSGAYTYGNNMFLAVPADTALTVDLTARGQTLKAVAEIEAEQEEA